MNKCIVVSDSFKGTLSSLEICAIAREAAGRACPACELVCIPVADGGEGTVDCFLQALEGRLGSHPTHLTLSRLFWKL